MHNGTGMQRESNESQSKQISIRKDGKVEAAAATGTDAAAASTGEQRCVKNKKQTRNL